MRRIALTALGTTPFLLGGCIFAVGHGEESDDRRLTRLEQRMSAAEKKLADQPKAAPVAEPAKAPAEEPKKP
jgi:hypothetical protein